MKKQSKKVELGVIQHAALEDNRAYLLRMEITKSDLNNRNLSPLWRENKHGDPSFYYVFNISLSCNINIPSFIENLWWDLLLGNHLNTFSTIFTSYLWRVSFPLQIHWQSAGQLFENLSSRYNHLCGGDYSGIWRHSRPMRAREFL